MQQTKVNSRIKKIFALDTKKIDYGYQLEAMGIPIILTYATREGVASVKELLRIFGKKEKVIKYIRLFEGLSDVSNFERHFSDRQTGSKNFYRLIEGMKYSKITKILERLKKYEAPSISTNENRLLVSGISSTEEANEVVPEVSANSRRINVHDFVSTLARVNQEDDFDELFKFLMRIFEFNETNIKTVLPYMNYKKIRACTSYDEMVKHIDFVNIVKNRVVKPDEKVHAAFTPIMNIESDEFCSFSKSPSIIGSIGRDTGCCFSKSGLAKDLLRPAIMSPISGIIYGRIFKTSWFSFVWDIVLVEQGQALKCLILDNVEAMPRIKESESDKYIWPRIHNLNGYHTIFCGTIRNDIEFQDGVTKEKRQKPYQLAGHEDAWKNYRGFDDSAELYTIKKFPVDKVASVKRMNSGDLARCKYLEQAVYTSPDNDFIHIDVEASPSYIIESSTNIYGYFTTRLKYFDLSLGTPNYNQFEDLRGKNLNKYLKKNREEGLDEYSGLEKVLYLEDILIMNYRNCLASMDFMFRDLDLWLKENGIKKIVANFNDYSENFIKRIKDAGYEVVEQEGIPSYKTTDFWKKPSLKAKPEIVLNGLLGDLIS